MFPRSAWTIVPGITSTAITSSDVPSARRTGMPIQSVKAGTITIPPPTPSSPDTNPAPRPIAPYFQPGVRPRSHGVFGSRPTITCTAVNAIRPAVTSSSRWTFTTSVSSAPATAPPIPGTAAQRAARKLTSPAFAYVYEPTREVGRMTGKGVAIAWIAVPPRSVFTAGVVTIPPPTPNNPDRIPAANPTRTPRPTRSGVTRAELRRGR
jgi:hypothetical protein